MAKALDAADFKTFADFRPARTQILSHLAALQELATRRNDGNAGSAARSGAEKLRGNQFYLAVLGQFKRGKTTLINSLLGADVLPVAVIPLTSIITILSYGEKAEVIVHFVSGDSRPIHFEELPHYVTERGNPKNTRGVRHVEVRYPSPYLQDGVMLVDTPGIGSTYEHNTEVTHSFLARVDAAIVLVSVDPPLTQVEAEFLRRANEEVHHFFFALNKIDQMAATEVQESFRFTAAQIEQNLGLPGIEVFPLSARAALEAKKADDPARLEASGLPAFEEALENFLMEDKGRVLLDSALADTLRLASGLRFSLEVERKAIELPLEDLEQKERALSRELARIEQEREDMHVLLRSEVARLVGQVEKDLSEHIEASTPDALRRLEQVGRAHPAAGRTELARLMDDFMAGEVETVFREWRLAENRRIGDAFSDMSRRFAEKTNAIIRSIQEIASGLFDVKLETFESAERLLADTHVYYKVDPLFYYALEKVPFVLPRALFRRQVLSKMRDRVPWNWTGTPAGFGTITCSGSKRAPTSSGTL